MKLRWEQRRQGMHHGSIDGILLAQVAHVIGPGGTNAGWMVWLFHDQRDLGDRYPTSAAAMAAAEAALDHRT